MKGLFVINSLSGGGAEKVFCKLLHLVDSDNGKGYTVEVVILDRSDEVYQLPPKVRCHYIDSKLGVVGQILNFIKLIKSIRPDFIVSFLFRSNWYNVIAAKMFGCKAVLSERGNTNARLTGRLVGLKKTLIKYVFNRADAIICVSNGVGECLVHDYSVDANKVNVLNNAYDFEGIKSKSLDSICKPMGEGYILAIGRLVKLKGFDDLITAYAQSNLQRPLLILGDGEQLESLKQYAVEQGVGERVHFLGFVANPYPYMKQANCFALTSHFEGFPNAMVESMSLSIPVISSMADGPIDILQPQSICAVGEFARAKYGLIFNAKDTEAIAKALVEIDKNQELHQELSVLSRERSLHYSEEKFYAQFTLILERAISGVA